MTSARLAISTGLLGLAAALAACSSQASAPATAFPVAFSGAVAPVVAALTALGFTCDPNPSAPLRTFGTAMDKVWTKTSRKPASGSGQGTFAYLYMLRADMSTIVGLDLLSDQAESAGISSPEVTSVIGLVFSTQDAAAVEQAAVTSTANHAQQVVGTVSVVSTPEGNAPVNLRIWGPEEVAAAAAAAGPAASN